MMNDKQIIIRRYTIYIRTKNILTFSGFIKSSTCPTISHIYVIKHNSIYTLSTRYLHTIYTLSTVYLLTIQAWSPVLQKANCCLTQVYIMLRVILCLVTASARQISAAQEYGGLATSLSGKFSSCSKYFYIHLYIFQLKNILLFVLTECVPCNLVTKRPGNLLMMFDYIIYEKERIYSKTWTMKYG